jgi:hypothetical protein
MKLIIPLLAIAICAGCATPTTKTVRFESDPPGARVFVAYGADEKSAKAKDFLGVTPFDWQAELNAKGGFKVPAIAVYSWFVQPVVVFTAQPTNGATNLFARHQVFHGSTILLPKDKVPSGIFFDLTKPQP